MQPHCTDPGARPSLPLPAPSGSDAASPPAPHGGHLVDWVSASTHCPLGHRQAGRCRQHASLSPARYMHGEPGRRYFLSVSAGARGASAGFVRAFMAIGQVLRGFCARGHSMWTMTVTWRALNKTGPGSQGAGADGRKRQCQGKGRNPCAPVSTTGTLLITCRCKRVGREAEVGGPLSVHSLRSTRGQSPARLGNQPQSGLVHSTAFALTHLYAACDSENHRGRCVPRLQQQQQHVVICMRLSIGSVTESASPTCRRMWMGVGRSICSSEGGKVNHIIGVDGEVALLHGQRLL